MDSQRTLSGSGSGFLLAGVVDFRATARFTGCPSAETENWKVVLKKFFVFTKFNVLPDGWMLLEVVSSSAFRVYSM